MERSSGPSGGNSVGLGLGVSVIVALGVTEIVTVIDGVILGGKGVRLSVGVNVAGSGLRSSAASVWLTITIGGAAVSVGKRAKVGKVSFGAGAQAANAKRLSKIKNRVMKNPKPQLESFQL